MNAEEQRKQKERYEPEPRVNEGDVEIEFNDSPGFTLRNTVYNKYQPRDEQYDYAYDNQVLQGIHWAEQGNQYVFQPPSSRLQIDGSVDELQGMPEFDKPQPYPQEEFDAIGVVPNIPDKYKYSPKIAIGVDFNSKGEIVSKIPIAMGAIPDGGTDITLDHMYIPHWGTYDDFMMGGYNNDELRSGSLLN